MKNFSLTMVIFFIGLSSSLMSMETMPKRLHETTEICVKTLIKGIPEFSIPGMSKLISLIKKYQREVIIISHELSQDYTGRALSQVCEHLQELAQVLEKIKQYALQDNLEQKDRIILNQYGFSREDIAEKENALRRLGYSHEKLHQEECEARILQQLAYVSTADELTFYIHNTIVPTIEKYDIETATLIHSLEMYQRQWNCNLLFVAKTILENFYQKSPRQVPPQSIIRFARELRLMYIKHKIEVIGQQTLILGDLDQSQLIDTRAEA